MSDNYGEYLGVPRPFQNVTYADGRFLFTEPVDLGFGEGSTKVFDLGFASHAVDSNCYGKTRFPRGTPLPPELVGKDATTNSPFKVGSWQLGLCIFFVFTDGVSFIQGAFGRTQHHLDEYEEQIASLTDGQCIEMNELMPRDLIDGFRLVLFSLLQQDPTRRASVQELINNKWLMNEEE